MNILIVILGSNVLNLLNDRINLGVNFASDERNLKNEIKNIDWFLSGGIKNPGESTASEAYKMSELISKADDFGASNVRLGTVFRHVLLNQSK